MAQQHWFDDLAREMAGEVSRRGALRRIGAAVAGVALGAWFSTPPRASAQLPDPEDFPCEVQGQTVRVNLRRNANHCGACNNRCPDGATCVPGTELGTLNSNGVCACRGADGSLQRACGARPHPTRPGTFVGGTCCRSHLTCQREDGTEACRCPQSSTPCPSAREPRQCCPNGISTCSRGRCECNNFGQLCGNTCCRQATQVCRAGKCVCRPDLVACGGGCVPQCPRGQFRDRLCRCVRCTPPNRFCPGRRTCLPPCTGGKIRDPQTCVCRFPACPPGEIQCGSTTSGQPHCCPSGTGCEERRVIGGTQICCRFPDGSRTRCGIPR